MPVSRGTVTFGLDEIDPPRSVSPPTVTFGIDEIDAPEDRPALGPSQARTDVFLRNPIAPPRTSDLELAGRGSMPEDRSVLEQRVIESAPPYQAPAPRPRPVVPAPRDPFAEQTAREYEAAQAMHAAQGYPLTAGQSDSLRTDLTIAAAQGLLSVPEAAVGVADIMAAVTGQAQPGKILDSLGVRLGVIKSTLEAGKSAALRGDKDAVAQASGVLNAIGETLTRPRVIADAVVQSIPGMVAGARAGRAVLGATDAAAALGEGLVMAGGSASSMRAANADGLLTPQQAALSTTVGVIGGLIGRFGNKIAERFGFGDVDSLMAGVTHDPTIRRAVATQVIAGAVQEGVLEELPQAVVESVLQNIGTGRPLDEGLAENAALSTVTGGVMGSSVNLAKGLTERAPRALRPEPTSDPLPIVEPTGLQAYMAALPTEAPVSRRPASAPSGSVKPWPFTQTRPLAPAVESAAVDAAGGPDVAPAAPTLDAPIGQATGQPIGQTQEMSDSAPVKAAPVLSEEARPVSDIQPGRSETTTAPTAEPVTFAVDEIEAVEPAHEFSSTQVNLPAPVAQKVTSLAAAIPDEALAKDGREDTPHITVKYGIENDDVESVRAALAAMPPVTVKLGKTSVFSNDEADVVKIDVDSPALHALNKAVAKAVPTKDTYPDYKPHVTVAYVKPGQGKKYAGNGALAGQTITFDRVTFSDRNRNTVEIPLGGQAAVSTTSTRPATVSNKPQNIDTTPANAPADFPAILADARANGYTGTPDALAGAYREIDGRRGAEQGGGETSPVALLEAIRDAGGIATDGSGEVQTLWEASPGFIVAGKTKDGSRFKKTRKMPRGGLLGVANVLKNDGTGLSWDGLREAISQNPAFARFADLSATDLLDEVMDAVARQTASRGNRGTSRGVNAAAGWWREVVNDAGLSPIEQDAADLIAQYVDPENRRELYDWLRDQADDDLSNVEVVALRRLEQEYASGDDRRPADSPVAGDLSGGADEGRQAAAAPVYASAESRRTGEQESALPGLERVRAQALGATDSKIARVSAQAPEDGFTLSTERADGRTLSAREALEESGQSSIFDAPPESEPKPFTTEAVAEALGQPIDVARGVVAIAEAAGFDLAKRVRVARGGTDNGTLYQSAPSPFYSRLIRAVESSTLTKASGAQWKATIRNAKSGINADEFALVGVADLFDPTTYTKQEILDYLSAHQVTVEDVTLREPTNDDHARLTSEESSDELERFQAVEREFVAIARDSGMSTRDTEIAVREIRARTSKPIDFAFEGRAVVDALERLASARDVFDAATKFPSPPQYAKYQEPGADPDSYREVFVSTPNAKASWNDGHAAYRAIANPIVRLRFNTRTTDDGSRVLFLEEVQPPSPGNQQKMPSLFTKHWREIGFKWAIRHAAEQGLDGVAWTPGAVQAKRYDLSKQIERVQLDEHGADAFYVSAWGTRKGRGEGPLVMDSIRTTAEGLPDIIGKDLAQKLLESKPNASGSRELSGVDLKVGGEGLVRLYDVDFRNVTNAIPAVKKAGAKVEQAVLTNVGNAPILRITPAIRDAVMAGQPLFQPAYHGSPHIFDEFSLHKIGTGEGAQAFGFGLYFSGSREVADYYRGKLGGLPSVFIGGEENQADPVGNVRRGVNANTADQIVIAGLASTRRAHSALGNNTSDADVIKAFENDLSGRITATRNEASSDDLSQERRDQAYKLWSKLNDQRLALDRMIEAGITFSKPGRTYKVEIPEDEDYLNLDKPITEQSKQVKDALKSSGVWKAYNENLSDYSTPQATRGISKRGDTVYAFLAHREGSEQAASEFLSKAGIPGLRYLDQGSRDNGRGTYNYVIFDDKLVKIMEYDQRQNGPNGARGSIEFLTESADAIIRGFASADASTGVHEVLHAIRRFLLNRDVPANERAEVSDADIDTVEREIGVKDGRWTTANEERFAEIGVQYFRDGKSPSPALRDVFAKFAAWLKDIFDTLSGQRVTVSQEMRAVLDRVFTRQERLTANAQRQTGPPQTNTSAKASRPPTTGPPSSIGRFALDKPINGTNGTSLVGYEWKWIRGERQRADGDVVAAKVSDWDNHAVSEGTGRDIVHVFYVKHANGTVTAEGINSAQRILGIQNARLRTVAEKEAAKQQTFRAQVKADADRREKGTTYDSLPEAARAWRLSNRNASDEDFAQTFGIVKDGQHLRFMGFAKSLADGVKTNPLHAALVEELQARGWAIEAVGGTRTTSLNAEAKPTTGPPQSAKAPAPELTLTPDETPADVAPVTVHKDVLGSLDQIERDAIARVKARREQAATVLFQGEAARPLSPEDRADMVAIGTVQIARGLVQYAKWEEAMAVALGERVRPYLADVYRTSAQRAGALKTFTPDDYLNFRRLGVSESEQQAMRALVTRTVIETGRLPKEHITFAEVRAEAEALHPDAVKHLAPWVPAQAQLRVVVDAARHRLNVLNREIYEAHKALVGVPEELALDRLRDIEAKERDARGLADTVMRMRSEAGRNLVVWRMAAGSERWQDTTFWRMRAKRALGLPPGVDLPVDVERKIVQIIEGGKDKIATTARTRRPAIPKSAEAKLAAAVAKMRAAMAAKAGPSPVLFQAERIAVDPSILDAARDFLSVAKDAGLNAEAAWATFAEMYGGGFDGARDAFESAIAEVYEREVKLPAPKPRKQTGPPKARAPRQKTTGAFDGLSEDDETPPGYEAPRERPTRQQRRAVENAQAGAFGDTSDPSAGFIEDDGTVEYADPNETPTLDRSTDAVAGRRAARQTIDEGQSDAFDTGDSAIEAQVQRDLAALIVSLDKSGVLETISALRKAGLLTGVKTHMRNLGGNTGFQLVEEIARIPSVVVDFALSLATGQRSVQGLAPMAAGRSVREAATVGLTQAAEVMRDGVPVEDYLKTGSRRELNSGFAWLDAYANTTFRLLSAEDRLFKSYAYRRSMEEQAFLRAKNTGVSAAEILMAPTPAMITQAIADAEFATFNNKNLAAGALRQMQANLERAGTAGKALSFAIDLAVPFANTPANVLARVLDYTVAGAAVRVPIAAWRAYTEKALTSEQQRAIALGLGRGLTGSAIVTLGYFAAAAGMATGGGDDDPADRNVATAAGRLPGAILIGDRWHTISPFSPVGTLFALGASLHRARTRPLAQEAMRGDKLAIVATKLVMEQPMLSGLQDVQQALANPGRYGESFASGLVGSFVPTLVSDVAGLFDPYRRDARPDGFSEALWKGAAVRLPGIRNYLPERTDVLGRTQAQTKTSAVDPTLASRALELSDPVIKALLAADVGVTFPKREPDETADAYRARSIAVGKSIERQLRPIVARPGFPNWSVEKRKDALEDAIVRGRRMARQSGPPQRQAR